MITGRRSGYLFGLDDSAKNIRCRIEDTIVAESSGESTRTPGPSSSTRTNSAWASSRPAASPMRDRSEVALVNNNSLINPVGQREVIEVNRLLNNRRKIFHAAIPE